MISLVNEYRGVEAKVSFQDGGQNRIARGEIVEEDEHFIKIRGNLGTMIIGKRTIYRSGALKDK